MGGKARHAKQPELMPDYGGDFGPKGGGNAPVRASPMVTDGRVVGYVLHPPMEPLRPKRALPKPGTMNARVLATFADAGETSSAEWIQAVLNAPMDKISNALSSLRTAGHVISEGTGRAKLWRLAP